MNIVIVGAGMIGKERIKALETLGENIVAIVDTESIKSKYPVYPNMDSCIQNCFKFNYQTIDWVFICTPHHETPKIAKQALANGFNILAEKPLGRDLYEYQHIEKYINEQKVNVGLNYRFYKGVNQLLQDYNNDVFGKLISVNMILALGDPPGSEKTWRLNLDKAGRGAILDPGIHLIDIAIKMSGHTLKPVAKKFWKGFWDTGIEEESHVIAKDVIGTIYNIQASVCRWRNNFRIEVNGTEGYGIVEGRNRNYGNQTYRRGRRWGWQYFKSQRDSEELVIDYDGEDSFLEETRAVLYGTTSPIKPATHLDNERCLEFIDNIENLKL
jgi:predicted dehydrogenase